MALSATLARVLHTIKRSIRETLESREYVEIAHPHIDPGANLAFYDAFRVTAPGHKGFEQFNGSLLVSGGRYMFESARAVGRVYRIGPTFRIDDDQSNRLFEFQSVHVVQEAPLADALGVLETALENIIRNTVPLVPARRSLLDLKFPLRRVSRAEAAEILSLGPSDDLKLRHQMELLSKLGVPALFLTHNPPSAEPYAAFHRVVDGKQQNFELLAEFGGELLGGSEYETDERTLRSQLAGSKLLARAVELGTPAEEYAKPTIEIVCSRAAPLSTVYCGFERLVQFVTGTQQIRDVSLFPVTRDFLLNPSYWHPRRM